MASKNSLQRAFTPSLRLFTLKQREHGHLKEQNPAQLTDSQIQSSNWQNIV